MAYDKIIDSAKLDAAMTATADKIRAGTGNTAKIPWDESNGFADSVPAAVEQATPSISVSSGGLITASATQGAGIVKSGTKSATKQLTVQAAKTVTPSSSAQTAVARGRYTTGAVTVAAIPSTYKRVATGTITANASSGNLKTYPLTVSGLGFTPSRVILWLSSAYAANAWDSVICVDWSGTNTKVTYVYNNGSYCEECGEYTGLYMETETNKMTAGNTLSMSVGNGYFTLSSDKGGINSNDVYYVGISAGATYSYIAFA